jgi:hypothetical protein
MAAKPIPVNWQTMSGSTGTISVFWISKMEIKET